jgi:hypothetical protein
VALCGLLGPLAGMARAQVGVVPGGSLTPGSSVGPPALAPLPGSAGTPGYGQQVNPSIQPTTPATGLPTTPGATEPLTPSPGLAPAPGLSTAPGVTPSLPTPGVPSTYGQPAGPGNVQTNPVTGMTQPFQMGAPVQQPGTAGATNGPTYGAPLGTGIPSLASPVTPGAVSPGIGGYGTSSGLGNATSPYTGSPSFGPTLSYPGTSPIR